jgi:hypothetical protein
MFISIILLVPFHISLSGGYKEKFFSRVILVWLGGLFKAEYSMIEWKLCFSLGPLDKSKTFEKKEKKLKSVKKEKRKKKKKKDRKKIASNPVYAMSLLKKIVKSLSLRGSVRGVIGLDNPADTGMLFGLLGVCSTVLPIPVSITPNFERETVEIDGNLKLRIILGELLVIAVGLLFTKEGRVILKNI